MHSLLFSLCLQQDHLPHLPTAELLSLLCLQAPQHCILWCPYRKTEKKVQDHRFPSLLSLRRKAENCICASGHSTTATFWNEEGQGTRFFLLLRRKIRNSKEIIDWSYFYPCRADSACSFSA